MYVRKDTQMNGCTQMDRHTGRQIHTYTDGENRLSKYPGSGLKEEGGESVFGSGGLRAPCVLALRHA